MIPPYEIFLRSEVIDSLRGIRATPRKLVARFIDSLALDPFAEGDYVVKDSSDRDIHIKIVGEYAVTYWADHPVKEIKIIDIRSADRA
jgi:mRNA-degrading endonuclease RelE of RelBE toxin-antitoxin system